MSARPSRRTPGPAWLYVLSHAHGAKPGITGATTPEERRAEIERASGVGIELVAVWRFPLRADARRVEGQVHRELRDHRTFGEWHSCDAATVVEAIEHAIEVAGVSADRVADSLPPL
jgi:Meiotically up-regulated gene 113